MKAASVAKGLTGVPRSVTLDASVSVSGQAEAEASDLPANIATPEGGSSSKQ